MATKKDSYWVGRFKKSGKIFLFDPAINSDNSLNVTLFLKDEEKTKRFLRSSIHSEVEQLHDTTFVLITKSAYERWTRKINWEPEYQVLPSRIEPSPLPNTRIRIPKKAIYKTGRVPECYCGEQLSSATHHTCPKCNWLICRKGHCGCKFKG